MTGPRQVIPGAWVVVVPDTPPGIDQHTVTVGGVDLPAFLEDGRLLVRCPTADELEVRGGYVRIAVDGVSAPMLARLAET